MQELRVETSTVTTQRLVIRLVTKGNIYHTCILSEMIIEMESGQWSYEHALHGEKWYRMLENSEMLQHVCMYITKSFL